MSHFHDVDDVIAKAAFVLHRLGHLEDSAAGERTVFRDEFIAIESYRSCGLNVHLGYTDTKLPAYEIWRGDLIRHTGDHAQLRQYVEGIYISLLS